VITLPKPKGYKSKRALLLDRKRKAKRRPRKTFKKGLGHLGDWSAKYYRITPKMRKQRKRLGRASRLCRGRSRKQYLACMRTKLKKK